MTTPNFPQQPYGPQPGYPPPPPAKKNNTAVIIILVIVGVLVLCGFGGCVAALSGSDKSDTAAATFTTASAPPGAPAPVGEPPKSDTAAAGTSVRDGKFEFTVTAVDPPVKTVGSNPYLQKTAQGQYIQVHLTVTNIGNRAQSYWASNQKLIDDQGRKFENDTVAGINVNDSAAMTAEINPGNSIQLVVVFDVPPGANPAALELHDSAFSRGAKVALR
ncbi:DUF4352 domain-containing protein [Nocardia sp. R7R-8]|uniref:DUF4352 domain-containing protein n=1 Tax=Nocardia sp. R7R-8 TaxID=3459304 RepID=UPI00403DF17D